MFCENCGSCALLELEHHSTTPSIRYLGKPAASQQSPRVVLRVHTTGAASSAPVARTDIGDLANEGEPKMQCSWDARMWRYFCAGPYQR